MLGRESGRRTGRDARRSSGKRAGNLLSAATGIQLRFEHLPSGFTSGGAPICCRRARAGKSALDGPDWASRMVLFRLNHLGLAPYENARHLLGLSETNWVNWTEQIRNRCGKEFLSRGMFPPRKYFTSGG